MRILTTICISLLLAGCASDAQIRRAKIEKPDDGAVVMRVLSSVMRGNQVLSVFAQRWDMVTVEREPDHTDETLHRFVIQRTKAATTRSTIYAASLPPGHYQIVSFSSSKLAGPNRTANGWLTADSLFSRFDVEAGKLTDLGAIVETVDGVNPPDGIEGFSRLILSHDTTPVAVEDEEIVREMVPGLATLLSNGKTLTWRPETIPGDMSRRQAYALSSSYGFTSPQEVEPGKFLVGSANGVVYLWENGRRIAVYDLGQRSSVEAVLIAGDGSWLAGGEFGLLKVSNDKGATWRSLRGNLPFSTVLDLHEWKGKIVATTMQGEYIDIYSAALGKKEWELLAHYSRSSTEWDYWMRPDSFLLSGHLVTAFPPAQKIGLLDLDSGNKIEYDLPGSIQFISASQDGVLRCKCNKLLLPMPYESHDFGKTWIESSASRWMQLPAFHDADHGVAILAALKPPSKFVYTEDGGKVWTPVEDAPLMPASNKLFWSRDGKTAYSVAADGESYLSRDDGHSWLRLPQ